MLNVILNNYYRSLQRLGKKKSTLKQVAHHSGVLVRVMGEGTVTPMCVERFVEARRVEGLAAASINGSLRVLRAALAYDTKVHGGKHPDVQLLREVRKPAAILSDGELEKLLACGPATRQEFVALAACALGAYAGLRHNEILHTTWGDVLGDVVRVTAKEADDWTPKSYEEREIPKHEMVRETLWALAEASMGYERVHGYERSYVFVDDNGRRLQSLEKPIAQRFSRLGVSPERKPGLHMLRRTFASRLLHKGADLETVRELMGHADIATTARYLSSTTEIKRAAVGRL